MREPDLQGMLAAAEARVRGARALLVRPRACNPDECITLFREAQGYLEWFRDSLPSVGQADGSLRRQAAGLAGEIRQAGVLIEQAALRGRRWLERLRPAPPEYTASGCRAPRDVRGHISYLG
ncbi:MAG: hypothetical protein ABSF64_00875 [Bryobacteraceae bacterium]|jgi:hypothetical protein